MIGMENLVMIDKETFFKYPTDYKIVPNTDTIVLDIKSEAEFKNYIIGTTPDPKIETISSCISLHLPPWLITDIYPHIESNIKTLSKATLDAATIISHPVTETAPVATPPVNSIQETKASPYDASNYTTSTS